MWVTIKNVASEAGVSIATVSRVLNNDSHRVAQKTREIVLKVAKDLDFRPSKLAVGLRSTRSAALGLIFPSFVAGTFYSEIFHAIEDEAARNKYGIILGSSYGDASKEKLLVDLFRERRVDGMIIIPSSPGVNFIYYQRLQKEVPLIFVDRYFPQIDSDRVTTDNVKGAYIATEHLIKLGHKRIVFLSGPEAPCTSIYDRIDGYHKALDEYNIQFRKIIETMKDINKQKECAYKAMKSFLRNGSEISAIFAVNDNVAIGALRAIWEMGLRVPDDIAVVGYDDDEMDSFLPIPLTSIAQQKAMMGRHAVTLLLERIYRGRIISQHICLKPQLVIRSSCGARPSLSQ